METKILQSIRGIVDAYLICNREVLEQDDINKCEGAIRELDTEIANANNTIMIVPSEAEMIVSSLKYSLDQLRTSHIDVFNHGVEDMPQDITDYVQDMTYTVQYLVEAIQKIADNDEGIIVVKRANK